MGQLCLVGQLHQAAGQMQMLWGQFLLHSKCAICIVAMLLLCLVPKHLSAVLFQNRVVWSGNIFGPKMASEAIPGHLIFKFYLGGGACPQIPLGPSRCVLMQLGQLLHTQILGPGVNTSVPSFVYKSVHYNCHTGTYLLVSYMKQLLKFLLLQLLKLYKG